MTLSFDAAAWVDQFKDAGGGFVSNGHSLHLCWAYATRPLVDNVEARHLYHEVMSDPAKMTALRDHIGRTVAAEAMP